MENKSEHPGPNETDYSIMQLWQADLLVGIFMVFQ